MLIQSQKILSQPRVGVISPAENPSGKTPLLAPVEVAATRLAICCDCENYSVNGCRLAGCCNKSVAEKVTWALSQCPAIPPKWLRII